MNTAHSARWRRRIEHESRRDFQRSWRGKYSDRLARLDRLPPAPLPAAWKTAVYSCTIEVPALSVLTPTDWNAMSARDYYRATRQAKGLPVKGQR